MKWFYEGWRWRSRPPRPYRQSDRVLEVPKNVLQATIDVLRGNPRNETCCFWYGTEPAPHRALVKAIVVPKQMSRPGNYDVPAYAIAEISANTLHRGWVNLAQIHSHPGTSVEHSRYDDTRAISISVLSLVFPHYGNWSGVWPSGIGVHEYQIDYWHMLENAVATQRIQIRQPMNASLLDLRQIARTR